MEIDLYNEAFFEKRLKHREWQKQVGATLCRLFQITSVVDFGCGLGSYLEGFKIVGAEVKGYELGYEQAKKYIAPEVVGHVLRGDVTQSIREERKWDCSFSIEVAEHIPPQHSDTFVKNLCVNSDRLIIMSAAPPGQGGVGHINCQPFEFWIEKIEKFEFFNCVADDITEFISHIPRVPKWIKKNLMIFSKDETVS